MEAVDHLDLVVGDLERSLAWYRGLLEPLGYVRTSEIEGEQGERVVYLGRVGGRGSISLRARRSGHDGDRHDRYALGLHHLALAAPSRRVVDERAAWLRAVGAEIESGPEEYGYTPGYYAVFFHDPDGIKLELLHRPVAAVEVVEDGRTLTYTFDDLLRHHGPRSPGGVAHAFVVMRQAFGLLAPQGGLGRREVTVRTAFKGPGARDAFEHVTRAVTEDRYVVDGALELPGRGTAARFVFEVAWRDRRVRLALRDGYVTQEFLDLAGASGRSPEQEARLTILKGEMASALLGSADEPYEVL